MSSSTLLQLLIVGVIFCFYFPFLFFWFWVQDLKGAKREFFRSVLSILERNLDNRICIDELHISYRRLISRNPNVGKRFKNAIHLLEDILSRSDSFNAKEFKDLFGQELPKELRPRISAIINDMRKDAPFSSISGKYVSQLNSITHAITTNNIDLAQSMLQQLADDIEVFERRIEEQSRNNFLAWVVSVVGIVFTLVFGLISILPLINSKP